MNRIESDRNGLNRADWIESETTINWIDWIESDRTRCTGWLNRNRFFGLYRPCLEAIKSYIWGICLKSEYTSDYKCWLGILRPQKSGSRRQKMFLNKFVGCLEGLRHVWKLTGNLTRKIKVDQKVNECSQRPPIGPNGSKLCMGGPEGSIYPYLRVRPWLMTSEAKNRSKWP